VSGQQARGDRLVGVFWSAARNAALVFFLDWSPQ